MSKSKGLPSSLSGGWKDLRCENDDNGWNTVNHPSVRNISLMTVGSRSPDTEVRQFRVETGYVVFGVYSSFTSIQSGDESTSTLGYSPRRTIDSVPDSLWTEESSPPIPRLRYTEDRKGSIIYPPSLNISLVSPLPESVPSPSVYIR